MAAAKPLRKFSEYFGLNKKQSQLDFVDIPLDTDVPLYVDPYALSVSSSDWLRDAANVVVDFFDLLISSIRAKDKKTAMWLLSNLHEPNDTHLGVSTGEPSGRGWGLQQAQSLYERLSKSAAVKSGQIKDITDFELLIPGVADDKISDMTINIIRGELVAYTEEQCTLLNIPTEKVNSGVYWDAADRTWASRYANLPVYKDQRIILVPKTAVRFRIVPDYADYYNRFVLEFLQSEHLRANDSLVRLLKNGNRVVFKKELKKVHPLSKEYLFQFSSENPQVLEAYKRSLPERAKPLASEQIGSNADVLQPSDVPQREQELAAIKAGAEQANDFHNFIVGVLNELFYPELTRPVKEHDIDEGRKRIDIVFTNSAERGFFSSVVNKHKVLAPYVLVECKNYSEDLKNPEIDQMLGRFSRKRGRFGIVVCRAIEDKAKLLKRLQDIVHNTDNVVMVLDDNDIIQLLKFKAANNESELNGYLEDKLKAVVM